MGEIFLEDHLCFYKTLTIPSLPTTLSSVINLFEPWYNLSHFFFSFCLKNHILVCNRGKMLMLKEMKTEKGKKKQNFW